MTYLRSIQILRGIAVIAVLGYHFGIPGFNNGFLGVDVFFVISGFLMANIYRGKSVKEFYLRRVRRLIPAYIVTIGATMVVAGFRLSPSDFTQLQDQVVSSLFLNPNIYFWSQNSYFQSTDFNPLLNLWSLGIEFHFYLSVPLIFLLSKRSSKVIPFLLAGSLISCLITLSISPKTAFFLVPFRLWEFLLGFLVVRINPKNLNPKKIKIISAISLICLGWIFIFMPVDGFSQNILFGQPGFGSLLTAALAGLLIGLNLQSLTGVGPVDGVFEWLGKYSYSLYLIHFPLLVFFNYEVFSGTNLKVHTFLTLLMIILLTFLLAILQYHFIEQKFQSEMMFKKFIVFALISLISVVSIAQQAQQNRFTASQKNVSNAYSDRPSYRCGKVFRLLHPLSNMCALSNSGNENRVLLFGNSHADALKDVFVAAADKRNVSVYFWASNNPLSFKPQEVGTIAKEVSEKGINNVYFHFSPGGADLNRLTSFVKALDELKIRSHILGPVPVWNEGIPRMLWVQLESGAKPQIQNYKEYFDSNRVEIEYLSIGLRDYADYFDLAKSMCTPVCRISSSTLNPYYFDTDHLTNTGALQLLPVLSRAIEAGLK